MRLSIFINILLWTGTTWGQTLYEGEYKSNHDTTTSVFNQVTLNLNCDKSFIIRDNSFATFGKWVLKNERTLLLTCDSSRIGTKKTTGVKNIELTISEGKLYWKGISKRESRKLRRRLNKGLQEPPLPEDCLGIKKKESNYYLQKVIKFNCV